MSFFSAAKEVTIDLLTAPIELMKEDDWFSKGLGILVGGLYAATTLLIGALIVDGIKNPEYKYEDQDQSTGVVTQVEATPSQQKVLHRLSKNFGKAADFIRQQICDVNIKYHTTIVLTPMSFDGKNSTLMPMPRTTESHNYYNCTAFNAVTASSDKAELSKMEYYLHQAENSFSNRFLKL
jgi:hypothetical protein